MRARVFSACVLALAVLAIGAASAAAQTEFPFASNTSTLVFASDPGANPNPADAIGNARTVCLNNGSPSPCPAGSIVYDYFLSGWPADLSAIPGAHWIWGQVSPSQVADLQAFWFVDFVDVPDQPTGGSLSLTVDDFASAAVNGHPVGSLGSITDPTVAEPAHFATTTFDIGPWVKQGQNVIVVKAQNGPAFFGGCSSACTYHENPAGVAFGGSISTAQAQCLGHTATITGTGVINGTNHADVIVGSPHADTINGYGGDDIICGGLGNDKIHGNRGDDMIAGDTGESFTGGPSTPGGHDQLFGDEGNDQLAGEGGNDSLHGGAGNDFATGQAGNDNVFGESGNDQLFGGPGKDTLRGGGGNDVIFGNFGSDRLYGDKGNDALDGDNPNPPLVDPNPNFDHCIGGLGTDTAAHCEQVKGVP